MRFSHIDVVGPLLIPLSPRQYHLVRDVSPPNQSAVATLLNALNPLSAADVFLNCLFSVSSYRNKSSMGEGGLFTIVV